MSALDEMAGRALPAAAATGPAGRGGAADPTAVERGGPGDLDARYAPGEAAGPLLRAILGGLLGSSVLLAFDRIWPEPFLSLGDVGAGPQGGLPQALLLPALLADLVLGQPQRTAMGILILALVLTGINFIYVYGQFRRFVPGGDLGRGLVWGGMAALLGGGTLLPRAIPWLGAGTGEGTTGRILLAAGLLTLEFVLAILTYGLTAAVISPVSDPSAQGEKQGERPGDAAAR